MTALLALVFAGVLVGWCYCLLVAAARADRDCPACDGLIREEDQP